MKTETLTIPQALKQGLTLPFALVRGLSRVTLGPTPAAVDPEDFLEARFFDAAQEIRIFPGPDGLQAARLTAEPGDISLKEVRKLQNPIFDAELTLSQEVGFDRDGQAYIFTTRLAGWKGGGD